MSALEEAEWMAYAQIEPFGEERNDLRVAMMAADIVNHLKSIAHMWAKKGSSKPQPAKIEDFMPFSGKDREVAVTPVEERTEDDVKRNAERLMAKMKGLAPFSGKAEPRVIRKRN